MRLNASEDPTRLIVAAVAGVLLIAAAVLITLVHSERRPAGTNLLAPLNPTVEVQPGDRACELIRHLPAGAGYVRLGADAPGDVSLEVTVRKGGPPVNRGRVEAPAGTLVVPLTPETKAITSARLCVDNRGSDPVLLFGERKRGPDGPEDYRYRFGATFLEAGSTSLLSRSGVIAQRYGNAQAGALDSWALWLALLLGLAAGGLGLTAVLRQEWP